MYTIKCDYCKKENEIPQEKINKQKDIKHIYCSHCGRAICIEFKGEKYYE